MTESFEALLEESLAQQNLKPGTIVTGTVMEIRNDTVVVNAGLKSEGIVPIGQFKNLVGCAIDEITFHSGEYYPMRGSESKPIVSVISTNSVSGTAPRKVP